METSNNPVKLNLPEYSFRLKKVDGKVYIFDEVRKKFIVRTPEEWVRQHFIQFLIKEKKYSPTLMAIEKKVMVNSQPQRFDLLIYNRKGAPHVVANLKRPASGSANRHSIRR